MKTSVLKVGLGFCLLTAVAVRRAPRTFYRLPAVRAASPGPAESCNASKDLVVQALERLRADASRNDIEDANELLKRASDLCGEAGEAWYYRSVVETKLGHAPTAEYAMRRARMFPSDAMSESANPFVLSTTKKGSVGPIREKYALVIGVGRFSDTKIPTLRYPAADAQAFGDLLTGHALGFKPENVRVVRDEGANLRNIKEGLNWLARSAQPEDLVVVYVASHGSGRSDDVAGASYVMAHDTDVGAFEKTDSLFATALPMVELANVVATRVRAQRTAVFLDTCYSGAAAGAGSKLVAPGIAAASVSKQTLDHLSQGAGRVIFAASRTDQRSQESDELKHGYFTYYLLEALREHPQMQLSQIFGYVEQHVSAKVEADYKIYGLHQNPVMNRSSDDSDFALGLQPGASVAALRTDERR